MSDQPTTQLGIHWIGPAHQLSGYGSCSRNYLRAIKAIGIPLSITSILSRSLDGVDDTTWLNSLPQEPQCQEVVVITHGLPGMFWSGDKIGQAKVRKCIGMTIFETDRIPSGWAEACNVMD